VAARSTGSIAIALAAGACLVFAHAAGAVAQHPAQHAKAPAKAATAGPSYANRPEVRAFIDEMSKEHGFDAPALRKMFAGVHYQPQIVAAMQRPLLAPPKWFEYAPPFLSQARIDGGVVFWADHAAALTRAETELGVPPEIIVAIIGVETFYGRNTGRYRVIDALSTLAFDYPRRAAFFRGELRDFLLLARDLGVSPLVPKGSFAGAIGLPQFMPGSYRNFAIDFDDDGRVDLWGSIDDVIGSVANFLVRHDWERGQPVLLHAAIADEKRAEVLRRLDGGISERRGADAWVADGVSALDAPADLASDPVGLLMLEESEDTASYWIAANNFYVITRYNRSRLYAASVWNLAQAIKSARAAAAQAPR
jgi:membrane-bound lytic murein transglycosylase B